MTDDALFEAPAKPRAKDHHDAWIAAVLDVDRRTDAVPVLNGVRVGARWRNVHTGAVEAVVDIRLGGHGSYTGHEATVLLSRYGGADHVSGWGTPLWSLAEHWDLLDDAGDVAAYQPVPHIVCDDRGRPDRWGWGRPNRHLPDAFDYLGHDEPTCDVRHRPVPGWHVAAAWTDDEGISWRATSDGRLQFADPEPPWWATCYWFRPGELEAVVGRRNGTVETPAPAPADEQLSLI